MHAYSDEKRVIFTWDDIRKCCTTQDEKNFISDVFQTGQNFMRFYDIIEKLGYLAYIRGRDDAFYEMLDLRRTE